MTNSIRSRLSKLEKSTMVDKPQRTYISISVEDWERGDLDSVLRDLDIRGQPIKAYIGISPDDWDNDQEQKCSKKKE